MKKNKPEADIKLIKYDLNDYGLMFDFVEFVRHNRLDSVIVDDFESAEKLRNAFYFSNYPEPIIYTLYNNSYINDYRFIKYHINYELISDNIFSLIVGRKRNIKVKDKGILFSSDSDLSYVHKYHKSLNILTIDSPSIQALKKIIPHFHKVSGIKVNIEIVSFNEISLILNDINKAEQYDIIRIDMESFPWFAKSNFTPFNFITKKQLEKNYSQDIIKRFCLLGEDVYAVPFDPSIQILFYRKDFFENQTIRRLYFEQNKKDLSIPKNFEEFNSIVQFFSENKNSLSPTSYGTALVLGDEEVLATEFFVRYYALSASLFELNSLKLDVIKSIDVLINLKTLFLSAKLLEDKWWSNAVNMLENKTIPMLIIYMNHFFHLSHAELSPSLGFAPVPGDMPLFGGGSLVISKHTVHKQECIQFLSWFMQDEIHDQYVMLGGNSARKNILSNQEIIKTMPWLPLAYEKEFNGIRENINPLGFSVNLRKIEFFIGKMVKKYLFSHLSEEQVIGEINRYLSENEAELMQSIS
ncbi:extracellular solute-binding protein [Testudinibacter sp. TR-2022]|nr:extracellular solute-binding protein [Testudinibacter sp. TR-2022]